MPSRLPCIPNSKEEKRPRDRDYVLSQPLAALYGKIGKEDTNT